MRLMTLVGALVVIVGAGCAGLPASKTLSVLDLANASSRLDHTVIRVSGVVCDVGLKQASLQPGPSCADIQGIRLYLDRGQKWPTQGTHVVVIGRFEDNSQDDGSLSRPLNYPGNGYLGNYSILVRKLLTVRSGPNDSFKPNPIVGRLDSGVRGAMMDADNFLKLSIGLSGALVGFFLAQIATTARAWLQRRKTLKLLVEELKDIDREATRLLYFYGRNLQLHGAQGVGDYAAIGISDPIFLNYYKDVLLHLNQNQRISFQMIHSLVAAQNRILSDLEAVCSETRKEHRANGLSAEFLRGADQLGELTKHGYSNCAIIKWHVNFHLTSSADPDLSPETEDHRAYLKYLESVVKEMERTIETGKTISKDKFEKIYNPDNFKASP